MKAENPILEAIKKRRSVRLSKMLPCIAVFLDHLRVYDRTKDVEAVGCFHPAYAPYDPFDGIRRGMVGGDLEKQREGRGVIEGR